MQTIIITAAITLALSTMGFLTYGQTFSEWWRQKKTKMKYLRKQVAALEMLKATIEEGNSDAAAGIDSEEVNMMLEYKMAWTYLTSLGEVKPIFLKKEAVRSSYSWAKVYMEDAEKRLAVYSKSPWLSESELRILRSELDLVKSDMQQTMRNLRLLITEGKVEMEDGDRWEMINGFQDHVDLAGRFLWTRMTETNALIEARQQQAANDEYLKNSLP